MEKTIEKALYDSEKKPKVYMEKVEEIYSRSSNLLEALENTYNLDLDERDKIILASGLGHLYGKIEELKQYKVSIYD